MPRHAPPPPVTPVDPYAATEPVLSDTLEQAEVPMPPAAGAAVLSELVDGAATAPWKDAAAEALHRAAALEQRRDALLRGLESRPRDPHTDRIRRRLALLRAAVARDAERPFEEVLDGWLEKELMPRAREIVPALFKLSEEGEEEELQMVQRQRLQSLSLHHRIGDRSGAAGLAATLQMMAGVGDGA